MLKRKPFIVMWLAVDLLALVKVSCRDIRRSTTFEVKDFYARNVCLRDREAERDYCWYCWGKRKNKNNL